MYIQCHTYMYNFTEEEEKIKQAEEDKIQALLDMNEDEYELLSFKEQKKIDDIRHQRYLEKRRRLYFLNQIQYIVYLFDLCVC